MINPEHVARLMYPAVTPYGRNFTTEVRGGDVFAVRPDGASTCIWTQKDVETDDWKFRLKARLRELKDWPDEP